MRAVVVSDPGGLDKLTLQDCPDTVPDRQEVVIDVAFAGCNWSDIQKRQGIYPDPVTYPARLGAEVSGIVRAVGPGVRGIKPGMRVAAICGPRLLGGFAERVALDQRFVIPLPPEIDLRLGAAFPVVALTAWHLLHTAHRLRRGETILVHAASGGVGLALVQLARLAGARAIGTVGSASKVETAKAYGAHRVVVRSEEDFVAVALEETLGRGVDLVVDSLGADILSRSFDALRRFGRLINIGEAAGDPDFPVRAKLYERSTSMAGFELLHAEPGSPVWRRGLREVIDAIASGRLTLPIAAEFPVSEIREAHRFLESRGTVGKVLISVGG